MEVISWPSRLLHSYFWNSHNNIPAVFCLHGPETGLFLSTSRKLSICVGWLLDNHAYIEPKYSFWKIPPFSHSLNKSICSSPWEPFEYIKDISLIPFESVFPRLSIPYTSKQCIIRHSYGQESNSGEWSLPNASFPGLGNQVHWLGQETHSGNLPKYRQCFWMMSGIHYGIGGIFKSFYQVGVFLGNKCDTVDPNLEGAQVIFPEEGWICASLITYSSSL